MATDLGPVRATRRKKGKKGKKRRKKKKDFKIDEQKN